MENKELCCGIEPFLVLNQPSVYSKQCLVSQLSPNQLSDTAHLPSPRQHDTENGVKR